MPPGRARAPLNASIRCLAVAAEVNRGLSALAAFRKGSAVRHHGKMRQPFQWRLTRSPAIWVRREPLEKRRRTAVPALHDCFQRCPDSIDRTLAMVLLPVILDDAPRNGGQRRRLTPKSTATQRICESFILVPAIDTSTRTLLRSGSALFGVFSGRAVDRRLRPTHNHQKDVNNEQPDRNVVEEPGLRQTRPELIRSPKQKSRRQQDCLCQFLQIPPIRKLENYIRDGDHRQ